MGTRIRDTVQLSIGLRWLVLVAASSLAFRHTVDSVLSSIRNQTELSYVPAVIIYALFAAAAVRRSRRPVVEIHDRETDFIVGGILAALAIAATTLLAPTLTGGYRMWRVDLLMMWAFAVAAGALLFGLRRVLQFGLAWLTLGLIWPLPGRLLTYVAGGGDLRWVAGGHLCVITIVAFAGRRRGERRGLVAPLASLLVGASLLLLLDVNCAAILIPLPALAGIAAAAATWLFLDRPLVRQPRTPPVVGQWRVSGICLVAVAIVGSLVIPPMPRLGQQTQIVVDATANGPGPVVPAGWSRLGRSTYPEQSAYFGVHASWERYRIRATGPQSGPEAVDTEGRHREMVIDVTTTERPRTLDLFPITTTYAVGSYEMSAATDVDLGHGVKGQLYAAVDPRALLTWSMLTFSIQLPADRAVVRPSAEGPPLLSQRITLILVDDHRPGATFPQPTRALLDRMRAVMAAVLRGSSTAELPEIKNADLLTVAGRRLLTQRVAGSP